MDVELWMEEVNGQTRRKLNYSFFEKKLKTPYCVMKSSAMPASSKISILSQDLIRRMMNCSETVSQSERDSIVNKYIDRLVTSGYNKDQVREIVESGLLGYERKLERARKNKIPLHRPAVKVYCRWRLVGCTGSRRVYTDMFGAGGFSSSGRTLKKLERCLQREM